MHRNIYRLPPCVSRSRTLLLLLLLCCCNLRIRNIMYKESTVDYIDSQSSTDYTWICVDTKISELKCAFCFFKLRIIQLLYIAQRAAQRPAAWYVLLLHDARCVPRSMSSRCSPCCLVRAVCCVLSSCGGAKTKIICHADEKVSYGFCMAPARL